MAHPYVTSTWYTSYGFCRETRYCGTAGEVEGIFRLQTPWRLGRRGHLSLWHGETRHGRLTHGSGCGGESPGEWLVPCKSRSRLEGVTIVRTWNVHNLGIPLIASHYFDQWKLCLYTPVESCRIVVWKNPLEGPFACLCLWLRYPFPTYEAMIYSHHFWAWQLPSSILKCSCQCGVQVWATSILFI